MDRKTARARKGLKNIETVEDAMNQCIKEKNRKESIPKTTKRVVRKPKWFDEKPQVELATPEEMKEMDEFLKQFE